MKTFYVEIDTNDGDYVGEHNHDYVGHLVTISNEEFERFKSLIEKIKNFKPYESCYDGYNYKWYHNFPYGRGCCDWLEEKSVCELYDIDEKTLNDFIHTFKLYGGEDDFHTITTIQEVTLGERIL
jgi:hypothetical protein